MKKFQINYRIKGKETYAPLSYIVVANDKEQALERFNDRPKVFEQFGEVTIYSILEIKQDGKENAPN